MDLVQGTVSLLGHLLVKVVRCVEAFQVYWPNALSENAMVGDHAFEGSLLVRYVFYFLYRTMTTLQTYSSLPS
jgi:hypothetical protein